MDKVYCGVYCGDCALPQPPGVQCTPQRRMRYIFPAQSVTWIHHSCSSSCGTASLPTCGLRDCTEFHPRRQVMSCTLTGGTNQSSTWKGTRHRPFPYSRTSWRELFSVPSLMLRFTWIMEGCFDYHDLLQSIKGHTETCGVQACWACGNPGLGGVERQTAITGWWLNPRQPNPVVWILNSWIQDSQRNRALLVEFSPDWKPSMTKTTVLYHNHRAWCWWVIWCNSMHNQSIHDQSMHIQSAKMCPMCLVLPSLRTKQCTSSTDDVCKIFIDSAIDSAPDGRITSCEASRLECYSIHPKPG